MNCSIEYRVGTPCCSFLSFVKNSTSRSVTFTGPEYHLLLLMAVRAGLRRGELVALQWGDVQLGGDDKDSDRFILVQHNYVRREHTTTKSKKSRRVDLSRELRRVTRRASRQKSVGVLHFHRITCKFLI